MKLTNEQLLKLIQESMQDLFEADGWTGPQGGQGPEDRYMTPKQRLGRRDIGSLSFPDDEEEEEETDYYEDEMDRPWDDRLKDLLALMEEVGLMVIDHYKGKPNFGPDQARKEISETIQAAVDNFVEGSGMFGGLETLVDEEF